MRLAIASDTTHAGHAMAREQEAGATLYHGDALTLLPALPTASVDAVITDPPYLLGAASARVSADKVRAWASDVENAALWYTEWYRQVWRLLRPAGSFWTFCHWHSLAVVQCAAAKSSLRVTSVLVWNKQWPGVGSTRGLRQCYELIALMGKPEFGIKDRALRDIWDIKWGGRRPTGHPAEKPTALVERIIEACSLRHGSVVLDPFMGSGTVGVACADKGCSFIGIEREADYLAMARARLMAGREASVSMETTRRSL